MSRWRPHGAGVLPCPVVNAASSSTAILLEHHPPRQPLIWALLLYSPVRLAYRPPANSTFLSEQTSHQQPASSTFLSEQISVSHQPPAKRTGRPEKFNSFGSPSSHPNPIAAAIKSQTSISKMWTLGWDSVLSRIGSSELSVSCASFFPSGVLGVGTREWRCSLGAGKGTLERRHNREGGTRASVPGRTAEASLKPCSRYQELVIADFFK
jgi:hypothetical protein